MTTSTEFHDLLTAEASGPSRSGPGWDDIVCQGRRHRRVTRVRNGLAMGGLAAVVAVGAFALADGGRDDERGVVAHDPDGTAPAPPDTTVPTESGLARSDLGPQARVQGVFLTVLTAPVDPSTGVDPCREWRPRVTETPDQVIIELVLASLADNQPWAGCQASAFSGHGLVELTDPLGDRRLVDGWDGSEISVTDGVPLLFPTFVPEPFDEQRWDEFGGAPPAWTFSWTEADLYLNVTTDVGDALPCDAQAIEVRGIAGRICGSDDSTGIVLDWDEGGRTHRIETGHVSDGTSPFTVDDVLAVAEGLEPLGG